ncbi:MAG: nucleoside deaminase [Clostridia bacterium]|nr:nucleoside deaminase [Clostridia bacterium]
MEANDNFMKQALREATKAYHKEEVPIGAVIVKDNKIIARAHNLRETTKQACSHAEILAIQKACKKMDAWRLEGCKMYVTLEPCPMCAGAIINARIGELYIGAMDPKGGAVGSKLNLLMDYKFNHTVKVYQKICEKECSEILKSFFKELRKKKLD